MEHIDQMCDFGLFDEEEEEEGSKIKLSKDIIFEKGMNIKLHITSPYGEEFDEIRECEVVKITRYKKGNKIYLVQHYGKQNSTGFGIWQNDYPHLIEIV